MSKTKKWNQLNDSILIFSKKKDKEKKEGVDLGDLAEEFAKKRLEKELEK